MTIFTSFTVEGKELMVGTLDTSNDVVSSQVRSGHLWSFDHVRLMNKIVPINSGYVLDIGAHIGTFSLGAAALGYKVCGFEPSPSNFNVFRDSVEKNKFEMNVKPVNVGCSDCNSKINFEDDGPYSHATADLSQTSSKTITVNCKPVSDILSELNIDSVSFIKLDAEGYELKAILGMKELLSRADSPPMLVESNGHTLNFFKQTPNSLFKLLESLGYKIFVVMEAGKALLPVDSNEAFPFCVCDLLCIKNSQINLINGLKTFPFLSKEHIRSLIKQNLIN